MSKQDELFLKELLANAGVFRSYSDDEIMNKMLG